MTIGSCLSLPELASRYHVADVCGGSIAWFSTKECGRQNFREHTSGISCFQVQLIISGEASLAWDKQNVTLGACDLIFLTPFQSANCNLPDNVVSEGLLIEPHFYESLRVRSVGSDTPLSEAPLTGCRVYHLSPEKSRELIGLFHQIRLAIRMCHAYKMEMVASLAHVCLLFISELPYKESLLTRDFKHKENIFRIFMHLASVNFRSERTLQFYADKLCISSTYLSRIVKELSGNTVCEHLALLTFTEACNLLRHTDKSISEISFILHFNDQSAFANFFKLHAGMSPNAYRRKDSSND